MTDQMRKTIAIIVKILKAVIAALSGTLVGNGSK